jgi:DUF1680 family protein
MLSFNYMNKKTIALLTFLMFPFSGFGQQNGSRVLVEHAEPFPSKSVTLNASRIKDREQLNSKYITSLDPDRLLHNFRINAGLPSPVKPLEGWEDPKCGLRGHFVGHYLSAVSSLVERYRDTLLSRRLTYMVAELEKCQHALGKGYLSAFPESDFDKLETKFSGVWAPYYTYHKIMQGLLDVYTRTGNVQALNIVKGMADYVSFRMARLDRQTIEKMLYTVAANPPNEAGAMNEVLYKLYKVTGNPRHLALAKLFDPDWFVTPLAENQDILSDLHSNTHLVLVNGFAQRYTITGETRYRDAVINFWNMLESSHTYVNGTSSGPRPNVTTPTSLSAEHWGTPGHLSNTMTREIAESCVTHNTQKLTASLFSWTAQPKYAEAYMNTFYNAVMALQNSETGACVYHLPLGSPRIKAFLKENDFRCCNGTSIEAFAALNSNIYFHKVSDLWVNLYIPSEVSWQEKGINLAQSGEFPVDSAITFTITAKRSSKFGLHLLIPSWAKSAQLYINGKKQSLEVKQSSYLAVEREWHDQDKIKLVFDYQFRIEKMPDDDKMVAIFYGPSLLAFESTDELALKSTPAELLKNLSVINHHAFQLNDGGKHYNLRPFYEIESESYGVYAAIREY